MNYFSSKTCWITGGGSGIGAATAKRLADYGAEVFISGRNEENLNRVCAYSQKIKAIPLDVTNRESWKAAVSTYRKYNESVDLIVLNAGACEYVDLPEFDPESFKRVFDVNFMGIVNGLEALFPLVRNSSCGHITAVTSSVAVLPLPRAEAYGASKAAATYMLNSLRLGLLSSDIGVSIVMPGFVESPMTDKNDFPMPAKISADKAAAVILKGIRKKKHQIFFPGRFTWPLRLLASLPSALQQTFTRRFNR